MTIKLLNNLLILFLLYFLIAVSNAENAKNNIFHNDEKQTIKLTKEEKLAYQALAEILKNPKQRQTLINTLDQLANNNEDNKENKDNADDKKDNKKDNEKNDKKDDENISDNNDKDNDNNKVDADKEDNAKTTEDNGVDVALQAVSAGTKAAIDTAVGLPSKLAETTVDITLGMIKKITQIISDIWRLIDGRDPYLHFLKLDILIENLMRLAIIATILLTTFQGLNLLSRPIKNKLSNWVAVKNSKYIIMRKVIGIGIISIINMMFLIICYVGLHFGVTTHFGNDFQISRQIALLLNAFAVVEILKIILSAIFNPRYKVLRLWKISSTIAKFWYRNFCLIIYLLVYGYLLIVPVLRNEVSPILAQLFASFCSIIAFIIAVFAIAKQREILAHNLIKRAKEIDEFIYIVALRIFASIWHLLAYIYVFSLLVASLLQGENALIYILEGTLWSLIACLGAILLSSLVKEFIGNKISLPEHWQKIAPELQVKLTSIIPIFFRLFYLVLIIAVILFILNAWELIDIKKFIKSAWLISLGQKAASIFVIILLAFVLWSIIANFIESRIRPKNSYIRVSSRKKTLLMLFKNALTLSIVAITSLMVLSEIGVNIAPLLAGAGVLGLAIGFGSQELVRDVITGIFIQIENAMNTGDNITVDGINGTVEKISIRSVGLRDLSGTYHLIPFSKVGSISNFTRDFAYHVHEYRIAYKEDIDNAIAVMTAAFKELYQSDMRIHILEYIDISGVTEIDKNAISIRVLIKTKPGMQWMIGRAYNKVLKKHFDAAGIAPAFPQNVLHFAQDNNINHFFTKNEIKNKTQNTINE